MSARSNCTRNRSPVPLPPTPRPLFLPGPLPQHPVIRQPASRNTNNHRDDRAAAGSRNHRIQIYPALMNSGRALIRRSPNWEQREQRACCYTVYVRVYARARRIVGARKRRAVLSESKRNASIPRARAAAPV